MGWLALRSFRVPRRFGCSGHRENPHNTQFCHRSIPVAIRGSGEFSRLRVGEKSPFHSSTIRKNIFLWVEEFNGLFSPFDRLPFRLDRETAVEDNAPLVVNVFLRPSSTFL
jgi:hypothetical protein